MSRCFGVQSILYNINEVWTVTSMISTRGNSYIIWVLSNTFDCCTWVVIKTREHKKAIINLLVCKSFGELSSTVEYDDKRIILTLVNLRVVESGHGIGIGISSWQYKYKSKTQEWESMAQDKERIFIYIMPFSASNPM